MSRETWFRASGPSPGCTSSSRSAAMKDAARRRPMRSGDAGGRPSSARRRAGLHVQLRTAMNSTTSHVVVLDVPQQPPKVRCLARARRAGSRHGPSNRPDLLSPDLKMVPARSRLKTAATKGTDDINGSLSVPSAWSSTLRAAKASARLPDAGHAGYRAASRGFWFNVALIRARRPFRRVTVR